MTDYKAIGSALLDDQTSLSGNLGYTVTGSFRVIDPDDPSRYFVRFPSGNWVSAINRANVPQTPNRPVLVAYDNIGRPYIAGDDPTKIDKFLGVGTGTTVVPPNSVPPHDHVRNSGREFLIDTWLLKQLRVRVLSGTTLEVIAGSYLYNQALKWYDGGTVNLSSYVPAVDGTHRWVIISLNPATGALVVSSGSVLSTDYPYDLNEIEAVVLASSSYLLLAAVWLKGNISTLYNYQIEDLRFRSGAGSSASHLLDLLDVNLTGADSGEYLMYDGHYWISTPISFASPPPIGSTTPNTGAFTLLTQSLSATDPAANTFGTVTSTTVGLTANNTRALRSVSATLSIDPGGFTASSNAHRVVHSTFILTGTGTVTAVAAFFAGFTLSAAGTLTTAWGFQISNPTNPGGGTLTNMAGLNINQLSIATNNTLILLGTAAAQTGNWAILSTSAYDSALAGGLSVGKSTAPSSKLDVLLTDTGTNAVINVLTVGHNGGTVANNFGTGVLLQGEDSTTNAQDMARLRTYWKVATHATHQAYGVISAFDSAGERDAIGWGADGSVPLLGFYNIATAPIAKPTALTTQLTTLTFTAPGTPDYAIQNLTNAGGYGFVTQDEGNSVLSVIANLQTRVAQLETKLQSLGLIA